MNLFGFYFIPIDCYFLKKTAVNFKFMQENLLVWIYNWLSWKVIKIWQFISSVDTFLNSIIDGATCVVIISKTGAFII